MKPVVERYLKPLLHGKTADRTDERGTPPAAESLRPTMSVLAAPIGCKISGLVRRAVQAGLQLENLWQVREGL